MKTRIGFVSNSSSANCLIIGRVAGTIKSLSRLEAGKTYVMLTWHYLYEGNDVIQLDQEMLDWLKKHWKHKSHEIIEVEHLLEDTDGMPLPQVSEGALFWIEDRDYHYTDFH